MKITLTFFKHRTGMWLCTASNLKDIDHSYKLLENGLWHDEEAGYPATDYQNNPWTKTVTREWKKLLAAWILQEGNDGPGLFTRVDDVSLELPTVHETGHNHLLDALRYVVMKI